MKYKNIVFLLMLLWQSNGFAQAIFETNKLVYASGEDAWFYVDNTGNQEKVMYVSLHTSANTLVKGEIYKLDHEFQATGAFYLPDTLPSGEYCIYAYTQAMLKDNSFIRKNIYLVNRFGEKEAFITEQGKIRKSFTDTSNTFSIGPFAKDQCLSVFTNYTKNKASGTFTVKNNSTDTLQGVLNISYSSGLDKCIQQLNVNEVGENHVEETLCVEQKGMTLKGKITDKNGIALAGKNVLLSFQGKSLAIKTALTDSKGAFTFLLPDFYGSRTVFVSVYEPIVNVPVEGFVLEVDPKWMGLEKPTLGTVENWLPDLDSLRANLITVEKAYGQNFTDTIIPLDTLGWQHRICGVPSFSVNTADYISFSTFYEMVNEIVPLLRIKYNNKTPYLYYYDNERNVGFENPFVWVDGVPLHALGAIRNWGTNKVESIKLQVRQRVVGSMAFENGMVMVNTRNHDFWGKESQLGVVAIKLQGFSLQKKHKPLLEKEESLPDFRQTILFSNLTIYPGEEVNLPFLPSLLEGDFIFQFTGANQNQIIKKAKGSLSLEKI
jgi:hypothetical protein